MNTKTPEELITAFSNKFDEIQSTKRALDTQRDELAEIEKQISENKMLREFMTENYVYTIGNKALRWDDTIIGHDDTVGGICVKTCFPSWEITGVINECK